MSSEKNTAIEVKNLSKCFNIYENPQDRLKQMIMPRVRRIFGMQPKSYSREFWALQNISFSVMKGETLGIIGRNGSGKSTLLQTICGTLNPTTGTVQTNGRVAALLELGAGFNPEFTGRENAVQTALLYGLSQNLIQKKIPAIIEFSEIGEFIEQPVKLYSSGMYVRLAFAVLANIDPDVLIIDEALAVGDAVFQQKCMRFLTKFKEDGGTLLFVSHDQTMVTALCEKVVYIRDRHKNLPALLGPADEVMKVYLQDIYTETSTKVSIERQPEEPTKKINGANGALNKAVGNLESNRYVIGEFNGKASYFGEGGGVVKNVEFLDVNNNKIKQILSEELIKIRIEIEAQVTISRPSVTVLIKDKTGQMLLVDGSVNTFNFEEIVMRTGERAFFELESQMPTLLQGVYTVDIALADGTELDHIMLQWLHDVIEIRCTKSRSPVGITGFNKALMRFDRVH